MEQGVAGENVYNTDVQLRDCIGNVALPSPQLCKFLFSSRATALHPRRRELKLLPFPSYPCSISTSPNTCSQQSHLLVSSAGPREQTLFPAVSLSSSPDGIRENSTQKKGRRRRKGRKRKETAKNEGVCVPSAEEASIRVNTLYESGDPLGKKELGRCVVQWLKQGMQSMATKFASTERQDDGAAFSLDGGSSEGNLGFVMLSQPYLSATPMPMGQEALCLKASTHYPTLFDHFQRELRDVLLQQQNQGLVSDWRSTQSWMLLKELANSAQHRAAARKPKDPIIHSTLGISLDKTRLMQAKIEDFVKKMSDLLHIERDAELEFTQEELNATPMVDGNSKQPLKPVEYLVTHGQSQQEQCDTICNLNVISSSTGFIYNLGEDGCCITVTLKSRRGDPTFSKLFGKSVRIDRIQALADALTYERNCEALMLLQRKGLQKKNSSIGVVATLFGDKEDIMMLEKNNLADWGKSIIHDDGLLERHSYNFDASQFKAITLGLNKKRPVLIIEGPPGTGKTGLLSYLIAYAVRQGERVLVTAPSNAAVDNIVEKLSDTGLNTVRVGNPARISPSVASRSLGELVNSRLKKFTEEFERKKSDLRKDLKHCIQDDTLAAGIRQLLKQLGKNFKKKEKEVIAEVLSNADVVLSTNTGAADPLVRRIGCFDLDKQSNPHAGSLSYKEKDAFLPVINASLHLLFYQERLCMVD
uniref:DNA2/NAM7 helicase helicase domain-containing protein n=1 Tax=Leersia perrieri TaxID=77586 RepID=A0A0D9XB74_9ORYZ